MSGSIRLMNTGIEPELIPPSFRAVGHRLPRAVPRNVKSKSEETREKERWERNGASRKKVTKRETKSKSRGGGEYEGVETAGQGPV